MDDALSEPWRRAAERLPRALALDAGRVGWTFTEYEGQTRALAGGLLAMGLTPGDHLAMLLPPGATAVLLLGACLRAGLVACPLNTRWPDAAVHEALAVARCAALVTDRPIATNGRRFEPASIPFESDAALPEFDAARPATIVFTSGSTGTPKAAVLTMANHLCNARASRRNLPLDPGDRWLLSLPLYHVSGLAVVFRCLEAGATVAFPSVDESPAASLERLKVTHVSLVPTQLQRLMADPSAESSLSRLKAILLGGSAIPPGLIEEARRRRLPVRTTYGLTEAASQVATATESELAEGLRGPVSPLIPGSVRLDDSGQILLKGPTLFCGYLEGDTVVRPEVGDGWFPTGDVGRLDEQGRLAVLGRKDLMFISGGENVHPEEIERALCRLEGVLEAVVAPVDDADYGMRPVAFVRCRDGRPPDAEALRKALRDTLPGYKIPVAIHDWPEDATQAGGKIPRRRFLALAKAATQDKRDHKPEHANSPPPRLPEDPTASGGGSDRTTRGG